MKTSLVEWLTIAWMGRASMWSPAVRRSTTNTERPFVLSSSSSYGVVRARSSIRSLCSKRLVQIFCPLTT